MKIALIAGHDMDSQGAYGNAGVSEFEFNDDLIRELGQMLMLPEKHDYLHLYRNSDISGYSHQMDNLHKRIDDWGADVSIEFHFNSFRKPETNGNEVLYCSMGGKRIADIFDEALDTLPNRDRGVKKVTKKDRGGGFCCKGNSYAIILEPFFGSHQSSYMYYGVNRMILMEAIRDGLEGI